MLSFLRSSPSATAEDLARALALLNGRARLFRTTTLRLVAAAPGTSAAMVFDRDAGVRMTSEPAQTLHVEVVRTGRAQTTATCIGVPVRLAGGDLAAVLSHENHEPAELDDLELAILERAAEQLGARLSSGVAWPLTLEQQHATLREQWLATTLASIGDAVITTDATGVVTYMNPVATQLTGWLLEDAIGRPLLDVFPIFHETTGALVESPVDKVIREGHIVGLANHTVLRHRDGHLTPIEDSASPIRVPGQPLVGVVLVFRDATDVRREQTQREQRYADEVHARDRSEFLVDVAGALGEGLELTTILQRLVNTIVPTRADFASVWTVRRDGELRRAVYAPTDAPVAQLTAPPTAYPMRFPIQHVIEHGAPLIVDDLPGWLGELALPDYEASTRALGLRSAAFVPVRVGTAIVAVLAVASTSVQRFADADLELFTAIAAQTALAFDNARLYTESASLRATAEEATLAKDQFLARVSHDLRNPLGSILGWASLLKDQRHDPMQVAKGIAVIERNAKAQVQLIEDLLDISRIASGKLKLEISTQRVQEAIDTALDAARFAADAKGIALHAEIDRDVGAVAVDPDRFRQVIWNLVSNAVKFTPSGGSVRVTARRERSRLSIKVIDTGRGIPPEFLPRMFGKFNQANDGTRRTEGLGLGLAIVRHIVELHGGTVDVMSEGLGRGATFIVELPIRAGIRPSDPPPLPNAGPRSRLLEGVRVLVIDDEDDARDIVAAILNHAGATVVATHSADEGLEAFDRERPDAVVSDIGMPDRDGNAFMRQLRADPRSARVPSIALTALARPRDRIEVLAAGYSAHIAKPVEPEELVLLLVNLLQRALA